MKVIFAVPAYDGSIKVACIQSLDVTRFALKEMGIEFDTLYLPGCCYVEAARNRLVSDFMKGNGTDLFFIDSDVGFDPGGVFKILKRLEDIVGGIYPMKNDKEESYPVAIKTDGSGYPIGRDGLIEAANLPTGFLRIKRNVFEKMCEAYSDLKYIENEEIRYNLFGCGVVDGRWWGDDFSFCNRWKAIGGQMWVEPDIDFTHTGNKSYPGNYHQFLMKQPGGALAATKEG